MRGLKASEHDHQVQVAEWCEIMGQGKYPMLRWLYAVPNGGARHIVTAKKLKAEGVKPGVPDLCLPYPVFTTQWVGTPDTEAEEVEATKYHGLYIEMKTLTPKGRLSPDQKEWIDYLQGVGYKVVVAWTAIEAIELIEEYLNAK